MGAADVAFPVPARVLAAAAAAPERGGFPGGGDESNLRKAVVVVVVDAVGALKDEDMDDRCSGVALLPSLRAQIRVLAEIIVEIQSVQERAMAMECSNYLFLCFDGDRRRFAGVSC